ncbi:MAG: DNA ligase D [Burkholderiaceae bacterium]
MTLDTYLQKRDFSKTPEPRGKPARSRKTLTYVIQRHDASHLHYDFRLELDGVLKSWAIPKGPSLDPGQKRLAVQVEDHPLEYGKFEGEIPAHQYGAGSVLLWDRGRWIPDGDPHEGLRRGHLKFRLDGDKLAGGWTLVRMGAAKAHKENWLLIKERDAEAAAGAAADIVELRPESVSGKKPRTAKTAAAATGKMARRRAAADPVEAAAMPDSMQPQLATLAARAPAGDDWLSEIKYDGYRVLCRIEHGQARLFTRAGNDWSGKWPAITAAAAALPVQQAWLDGEVVALDADGVSDFQLLQNIAHKEARGQLACYLFDLLYLDGRDLRPFPLVERKQLLQTLLAASAGAPLQYSDHVRGDAPQVFTHACMHALEGIVAKRADAPYTGGRSQGWLKVKCLRRQEFVIGGYTDPAGSREQFGALLLGVHGDDGRLRYVGKVGTGFDRDTLHALAERFAKLESDESPFTRPPRGGALGKIHWLRPTLVAEVQFAAWTASGAIRHAAFVGLRGDKPAADITRETPLGAAAVGRLERTVHANTGSSAPARSAQTGSDDAGFERLTHPSRILFPDSGITKLDLARYYRDIAQWILPHLAGRPLTLVRCPQGQGRQCFFQRHAGATAAGIDTVAIPGSDGEAPYMVANSAAALTELVQLGVLELHTWGAREGRLDKPDRIIFDLDPAPGLDWMRVVEAAQLMRALLQELGLASFVKTTGGKGLHVVIPLQPKKPWDQIKDFSRAVAEHLAATFPERFTASMAKSARGGKIFIDYLRNAAEATAVAAYSTRARPGAPVSTPISWDELGPELHSDSFNLRNVRARLQGLKQDPWAAYFTVRQSLSAKIQHALRQR